MSSKQLTFLGFQSRYYVDKKSQKISQAYLLYLIYMQVFASQNEIRERIDHHYPGIFWYDRVWLHFWEAGLCNRVSQYRWPIHQQAFHLVPCSDPQRPDNCRRSIQGIQISKRTSSWNTATAESVRMVQLYSSFSCYFWTMCHHSKTCQNNRRKWQVTVTHCDPLTCNVRMNSQASQHKKTYQHQHPRDISHLKHLPNRWRRSDRERGSCGSIPRETQHSHTVVGPSCVNHRNNTEAHYKQHPYNPPENSSRNTKMCTDVYSIVRYIAVHCILQNCEIKMKLK